LELEFDFFENMIHACTANCFLILITKKQKQNNFKIVVVIVLKM
jgi:hypothetical protein